MDIASRGITYIITFFFIYTHTKYITSSFTILCEHMMSRKKNIFINDPGKINAWFFWFDWRTPVIKELKDITWSSSVLVNYLASRLSVLVPTVEKDEEKKVQCKNIYNQKDHLYWGVTYNIFFFKVFHLSAQKPSWSYRCNYTARLSHFF